MIEILKEHFDAVEEFKNKAEQYKKGELDSVRFKAFRVSMGIYEQRAKETYMTRPRIPGGVITKEQLETISALSKKYANGKMHITSRQGIQFQNVESLDEVYEIMSSLINVGITTKGTGGNTVRNVECSPLSGVSKDDVFDVTPYVKAVTDYLIKDSSTMNLPRKYKLAFSNSPEDTGNASISDLGFIAKVNSDGKRGFVVYGGGGFGGNPRVSIKLSDFIDAKDVLYYAQAMKEVFEKEGDRSNKHKARIRYIVGRLGEEKFIQLFNKQLEKVRKEKNLDLNIEITEKAHEDSVGNSSVDNEYKNVLFSQKKLGYYSVYIHPEGGNLHAKDLDKVLNFLSTLGYETSIRISNTQGFFVRDLKEEDAVKLLDIIKEFSSTSDIDNSLACAGASTCQLGLCLSQNFLSAIREAFKNEEKSIKNSLPRIFISGCPNSCGQHQKGRIGLSGRAKRSSDGLVPAYSVSFGGKVSEDGAKIGEDFGDVPAKKIPKFLIELAALKVQSGVEDFNEFLSGNVDAIKGLISKYSTIEDINENPDLYNDFGSCNRFSLEGRGAGECSTGVFDIIKLDLSNARNSFERFKNSKASGELYDAALSASRALLILKGIQVNKDREIFKEFIKNFVDVGYLKIEVKELIDTLIDYKLGDVKDISNKELDVEYVIEKVKAMYESLNGKLEITIPKEGSIEIDLNSSTEETSNIKDYEVIDFRGVQCPINFVKVKIELSKIKSGEKRGFYLDDGEPIQNVPKSVEGEGHKVVSTDTNYTGYNLLVVEKK